MNCYLCERKPAIVNLSRQHAYDAGSRITSSSTSQRKYESGSYKTYRYDTNNSYLTSGLIGTSTTAEYKNNVYQKSNSTTYGYTWWDNPLTSTTAYKPNTAQSTTWTSTYYYDASGHLTTVGIADGRPRTVNYVTDS